MAGPRANGDQDVSNVGTANTQLVTWYSSDD